MESDYPPNSQIMRNDKDNVIANKTIDFSLEIINYCEALEQDREIYNCKAIASFRNFNWRQCV